MPQWLRTGDVADQLQAVDFPHQSTNPKQQMWTCPKCGEQLEAQFDSCWKCAGPSPNATARRDSPLWALFGRFLVIAAALFGFYYLLLLVSWWPPIELDRRAQRKVLAERVESAGGWEALQRDCDKLVEQHKERVFQWRGSRHNTNELLPGIAALEPQSVEFWPEPDTDSGISSRRTPSYTPTLPLIPESEIDLRSRSKPQVVHIKIFGLHSSGGRSTPYFGLEVISGPNADSYKPRAQSGATGNGFRSFRKVTDRIFEVY